MQTTVTAKEPTSASCLEQCIEHFEKECKEYSEESRMRDFKFESSCALRRIIDIKDGMRIFATDKWEDEKEQVHSKSEDVTDIFITAILIAEEAILCMDYKRDEYRELLKNLYSPEVRFSCRKLLESLNDIQQSKLEGKKSDC